MHIIQIGENREALRMDGEEGEDGEEDPDSLPFRQAVLTRVMLRVIMASLQIGKKKSDWRTYEYT